MHTMDLGPSHVLPHNPAACTVDDCRECGVTHGNLTIAFTPRLLARLQPGFYWYFEIDQKPEIVRLTKERAFEQDVWTIWFTGSDVDVDLAGALTRGSLGRRVKPPTR